MLPIRGPTTHKHACKLAGHPELRTHQLLDLAGIRPNEPEQRAAEVGRPQCPISAMSVPASPSRTSCCPNTFTALHQPTLIEYVQVQPTMCLFHFRMQLAKQAEGWAPYRGAGDQLSCTRHRYKGGILVGRKSANTRTSCDINFRHPCTSCKASEWIATPHCISAKLNRQADTRH